MFCKNCGAQIKDDMAFCRNCGTMLTAQAPAEPSAAEKPQPINQDNQSSETVQSSFETSNEAATAPKASTQSETPIYTIPTAPYVQPPFPEEPVKDNSGFALAALILGIIGVIPCCCYALIPSILALIFGILGRKSSRSGMALAGIILGSIGILLGLFTILFYFLVVLTNEPLLNDYGMYF